MLLCYPYAIRLRHSRRTLLSKYIRLISPKRYTWETSVRYKKWLIKRVLLFILFSLVIILPPQFAVALPGIPPSAPTPPAPNPLPRAVLCNCYAFVKTVFPSLPSGSYIVDNLEKSGNIAVFYYPASGLYHYTVVVKEFDDTILIQETNYHKCTGGYRFIDRNDPYLIGFFTIHR